MRNLPALAIANAALLAQTLAVPVRGADDPTAQDSEDLLRFDLQILMNMDVKITSVSKRENTGRQTEIPRTVVARAAWRL